MKKSILSATGLAVALAFAMPALGNAAATTTAAPAASTTASGDHDRQAPGEEGRRQDARQEAQEGQEGRQEGRAEGLIQTANRLVCNKAAPAPPGWSGLVV